MHTNKNDQKKIDFCADVGSSFGKHIIGEDEAVFQHITSANIDCGWHGGDPVVMATTVQLAKTNQVNAGAHPGFPDLLGFGQRNMACSPSEIFNYIVYQVGALNAFCVINGVGLTHVKLAGNLYLVAVEDEDIAKASAQAVAEFDSNLIFVVLAGKKGDSMAEIARRAGLRVAREFFADRAYTEQGMLLSRKLEGSLITDPMKAAERVLRVLEDNKVEAVDGTDVFIDAQTICVHSFQTGSGKMAALIRQELEGHKAIFAPMTELV